jgi:hypothetical protein
VEGEAGPGVTGRAPLVLATALGSVVLFPHLLGEVFLASGEHLAGALPAPPHVTQPRPEHRLILAALGRTPPALDDPEWTASGTWLPALQMEKAILIDRNARLLGMEGLVARKLLASHGLSQGKWMRASLAVSRQLHERWTLLEQAELLRTRWGVHACGQGLDAAARACFGRSTEELSLEELAALVAHEHGHDSRKYAGRLLEQLGTRASSEIPTLPIRPSKWDAPPARD